MDRIVRDYRYYLRMERKLSPNTVAAYGRDVAEFLAAVEVEPRAVRSDDIARYLTVRAGAGNAALSKRSQARLLSALRSFFDWLILEGERKDNPCDRIDAPKLGRYLPAVLSVEEVTAILESVDTATGDWRALRDRAILEILYGCGLRVSEACGCSSRTCTCRKGSCVWWARATKSGSSPSGRWLPTPSPATWKCARRPRKRPSTTSHSSTKTATR